MPVFMDTRMSTTAYATSGSAVAAAITQPQLGELAQWNLADLYSGMDDVKLRDDLRAAEIEAAVLCAAICFRETRQIAIKRKIDSHNVLFDLMLRASCLSGIRLQHDEDDDESCPAIPGLIFWRVRNSNSLAQTPWRETRS